MFSFLLGIYLRMELLDHMVTLCLNIWGTAWLFSKAAVPFCIIISGVWNFQFLHILANTYCLFFFLKKQRTFFFFFGCAVRHVGALVLQPGIEPVPPAVEARSLNHWTAKEVPYCLFDYSHPSSSEMVSHCVVFFFKDRFHFFFYFLAAPGIEPRPLAVRTWSPNHWTAREFPSLWFWFAFPNE